MKKITESPRGVYTDYNKIFTIGIGGKLDDQASSKLLEILINTSIKNGEYSIRQSYKTLEELKTGRRFVNIYLAFREVILTYPITPLNWTSGERIPGVHSDEVALESIILAFQAHYKSSFQKLREVIELVILQMYFLLNPDKEIIGKWGRAEIRTPRIKTMMEILNMSNCYKEADTILNISNKIYQIYDDLGAYVHTRGVLSTAMGLTGSNIIQYSKNAFDKFVEMGTNLFNEIITLFCIFFPTGIISLPAFKKFGYFDPVWILREQKVEFVRSLIQHSELKILEDLARKNEWFNKLNEKINSLRDLSGREIEETYLLFLELQKDIDKFKAHSKKIDLELFYPYKS